MVWYLHWLELRWRLIAVSAWAVVAALFVPNRIASRMAEYAQAAKLPPQIAGYEDLLGSIGVVHLIEWHSAAAFLGTFLQMAPLMVLLTHQLTPPGSQYYLRSLPISRWTMLGTRLLAGAGIVGIATGMFLAALWLLALWNDIEMPWKILAVTAAAGLSVSTPFLAALGAYDAGVSTPTAAWIGGTIGFFAWIVGYRALWGFILDAGAGRLPLLSLFLAGAALSVAFLWAACVLERERDY